MESGNLAPGSIRRRSWYHTIRLPDGSVTPGYFDTRSLPAEIEWPAKVAGARCLDVGTFDGFWAFEMERRGAKEVIAVDLDHPTNLDWSYDKQIRGPQEILAWGAERGPGFREAAAALGSRVQRINRSVYDLDSRIDGRFDIVFCGALLLHLREPVRALERMREVCDGELILVEALDPTLDLVARRIPAARFANAPDQWWLVNYTGLARLVEVAGFRVIWQGRRFLTPFGVGVTHRVRALTSHGIAAGRPFTGGVLTTALRGAPRERIG